MGTAPSTHKTPVTASQQASTKPESQKESTAQDKPALATTLKQVSQLQGLSRDKQRRPGFDIQSFCPLVVHGVQSSDSKRSSNQSFISKAHTDHMQSSACIVQPYLVNYLTAAPLRHFMFMFICAGALEAPGCRSPVTQGCPAGAEACRARCQRQRATIPPTAIQTPF